LADHLELVRDTVARTDDAAMLEFAERWVESLDQLVALGRQYVEAGDMDSFRALAVEAHAAYDLRCQEAAALLRPPPPRRP
jgi:hypothetical protein